MPLAWRAALLAMAWLGPGVAGAAPGTGAAPAEDAAACRAEGGQPSLRPGFHRRADLDGDGRPDQLLDYAQFDCAGTLPPFCGTGGCRLRITLSRPQVARPAFDRHVRAWRLHQRGGRLVLQLDLHGSECGLTGSAACPAWLAWDGRRLAETRHPPR